MGALKAAVRFEARMRFRNVGPEPDPGSGAIKADAPAEKNLRGLEFRLGCYVFLQTLLKKFASAHPIVPEMSVTPP